MKKKFYFVLILFSSCYCSYGQSINYSEPISYYVPQDLIFKIAGKIGNNIHVWKFQSTSRSKNKTKSAITLYIFSREMRVISEQPITMMDEAVYAIDEGFQIKGNIYCAYIRYFNKDYVIRRQVLKIDEAGNVINSDTYSVAPSKPEPVYSSQKHPYTVNNRAEYFFKIGSNGKVIGSDTYSSALAISGPLYDSLESQQVDNDGKLYFATTESLFADRKSINEPTPSKVSVFHPESIYVYKKSTTVPHLLQAQYSSATFNFFSPRVALDNDNSIWVCASNKPDFEKSPQDSSTFYSLFLVRLDSSLKERPGGQKFLKINAPNIKKKIFYPIENAFAINKNIFLVSLGAQLTTYYSENRSLFQGVPGEGNLPPPRVSTHGYEIKSLRLLQIDESGNCILDTVISASASNSKLQTVNSFYSMYDNEISLLCLQQFPHNLNGITHIAFGDHFVKQNDILVDPRYYYLLPESVRVDASTYIVPFTHHGKIGFMKCSNID